MTLENYQSYLQESLIRLGFSPQEDHFNLIELFYDELIKWNSHTNLTRITSEKDFIDKHLLDSLSSILALEKETLDKNLKVIDIGTGAGFPVLPLWFFFPNWKITLVDSVKKKLDFISHFSKSAIERYPFLKEKNIEIIHSRAEDLAKLKEHKEKYDVLLSRAVARLNSLVEISMPFLKTEGIFVGMKGQEIDEEISEAKKIIKISGGSLDKVIKFELLDTGLGRSLVLIKKVKKTPADYPRKAGMAQKNPVT